MSRLWYCTWFHESTTCTWQGSPDVATIIHMTAVRFCYSCRQLTQCLQLQHCSLHRCHMFLVVSVAVPVHLVGLVIEAVVGRRGCACLVTLAFHSCPTFGLLRCAAGTWVATFADSLRLIRASTLLRRDCTPPAMCGMLPIIIRVGSKHRSW